MIIKSNERPRVITLVVFLFIFICGLHLNALDRQLSSMSDQLQGVLDKAVSDYKVPGIVLGVRLPDGTQLFLKTGIADLATDQAMEIHYRFRVGSITKTITSTVVLQLAEEGYFDLDDEAKAHLPARIRRAVDMKKITIRQLLDHTSLIGDYASDPQFFADSLNHPLKVYTPKSLVELGFERNDTVIPCSLSNWFYSNTNYALLGILIEHVTGNTVKEEITKRIINKLGMSSTYFPLDADIAPPHANGYYDKDSDGILEPEDDVSILSPSGPWTAGAIISTAEDLVTWLQALVDGSLLNRRLQRERFEWVATCMQGIDYGLGLYDLLGAKGHPGDINGFRSAGFEIDGYIIAILVNGWAPVSTSPFSSVPEAVYFNILPILMNSQ